jgi:hypothetical protein
MITDMETLTRVLPSVAAVCGEEGLVFQGTTEPLGDLPSTGLFTDLKPGSAAHGASFCVPLPFTAADIRAAAALKREAFAMARSWGGPDGFDSGADYAHP